ncbi:hypothetical protein [Micromonospora peucetia]|uniref:Ead/Ea22-like family protein n=1 Tax=Micromonospora peucetia TaxID=47871 RepID=A0ABZ1EJV9_9ACTN|nr:hypothetical protein [Micromonospora peucetia]WSA34519.1 hypothetical protein OIE14_10995 [Micromonospora peucetia]
MTTNDLDAIRKLADAATPGPWQAIVPANETGDWFDPYDDPMVVTSDSTPGNYCAIAKDICNGDPEGVADTAFIAAARSAVPALCDEVEQLRAKLAVARRETDRLRADRDAHQQVTAAARRVIAAGHLDWDGGTDVEGSQGDAHAALAQAVEAATR